MRLVHRFPCGSDQEEELPAELARHVDSILSSRNPDDQKPQLQWARSRLRRHCEGCPLCAPLGSDDAVRMRWSRGPDHSWYFDFRRVTATGAERSADSEQ